MKASFSVDGLRDIDNALADLPRATSKAVMRRALRKQLEPVAQTANDLWAGADDSAFAVSEKLDRRQPRWEASPTEVVMHVGSTRAAPHAHLIEFGTEPRYHESGKFVGAVAPDPSLGPAWETHHRSVIAGIAEELGRELAATMARRAKRGL